MRQFSLRTLIIVMLLGGPVLAVLITIARSDTGSTILMGYLCLGCLLGLVAIAEGRGQRKRRCPPAPSQPQRALI